MAGIKYLLFLLCAMVSTMDGQTLGGPMHGKAVVCYIASWATYREDAGKFDIGKLDPSLCTHLVYSFAGLDQDTFSLKSLDSWQDLEKEGGMVGYKGMVGLKQRYPHLKVTIAIGGWNEGSEKYSRMASTAENRAKFIKSVMQFLDHYKFDGLDLDWEYPTRRGGSPADKDNYVALVKELKLSFEPHGYILTAALGAGKDTMEHAYDMVKLSRYLDLIHLMCYDYHGTWDKVVGANTPLRGIGEEDVLSVEYTMKYMLSQGVSPYKLVLGLAMYGRTFILQDPNTKTIEFGKTPVKDVGFAGPYTKENGFMGYNEICMELTNTSAGWTRHWHEQTATPYLRDGGRIITYDNSRSIAAKVKMAIDNGLGGLMVWSIDTDDFLGVCNRDSDTYVDFQQRYNDIVDDPVLTEALKKLGLPDKNRLSKRMAYVMDKGRLHLRLPEPEQTNFALMTTINEATTLAIEEKRILDEMARITRENEIPDDEKQKPGKSSLASSSLFYVIACGFVCLVFGSL